MNHLLIFLFLIPGEPRPQLESAWYREQFGCEQAVKAMAESAREAGVSVLLAKCHQAYVGVTP